MIVALLQARYSSTRLPGKVLKPILGQPMLARQIERLRRARACQTLVVATSDHPEDSAIAELCRSLGVACHRGSLTDVLDRMYQAALPYSPSHVVRLTGDCPLADWTVIDRVVDLAMEGDYDYASNTIPPTFPDGLDVEVMRFQSMQTAWREATLPSEREHVCPFLHTRPERFRLGNLSNPQDLSGLRWTVDEPADFDFVSAVYEALYPGNSAFTTADILDLTRRAPELSGINQGYLRNEGYLKSLAEDQSKKNS